MNRTATRQITLPPDVRQWAFIGDAIWHLYVRRRLVLQGCRKDMTRVAARYVCAPAQALAIQGMGAILTEDEQYMVKRGKNAKYGVVPKNATPAQYHAATGMETLLGWLDEQNQPQRLQDIMDAAFTIIEGQL